MAGILAVAMGAVGAAVIDLPVQSTADCTVVGPDGHTYDLSTLTTAPYYKVNSTLYSSYWFYFNICGPIDFPENATNDGVCAAGTTTTCEVQDIDGTFEASDQYGALANSSLTWNTANFPPGVTAPGPMYESTFGECHRGQPSHFTSKVYFQCAPQATLTMIEDNYWDCYVHILMETPLACGTAPPPTPPVDTYRCIDNRCVTSPLGGTEEACNATCGPPPPVSYRCEQDKCVATSDRGGTYEQCAAVCF
mmetsp:Transcript_31766/g.95474  ORF Transcript_31766/g.95474 Transcript_31766/m.95474 type:complete len:250 (+) Transcript_31766:1190-1939(+)